MKMNSYRTGMLVMMVIMLFVPKQVKAQDEIENIDVSQGWEVTEFDTSYPGITADKIFFQGHENQGLNQKMAMAQFANIGKSTFTAKKVINLKKNNIYTINLIFAMVYTKEGSGFIDFNGDKKISDEESKDKLFQDTVKPVEDMEYVITIHFDVPIDGNGYFKLGYDLSGGGFIQEDIKGSVISKFESEDGEELLPPQVLTGSVGDPYKVEPPEIEGWALTEVPSNSEGEYREEVIDVLFIYRRKQGAPVMVKYLDEDNEEIAPAIELNGMIGENYTSEPKEIEHYSLIESPENMSGEFTSNPQIVIFKYRGLLYFKEIPQTITIGSYDIPANDSTYFVQEIKGELSVRDLRKLGSTWEISAQLKQEFIGRNTAKSLDAQLNYIDSNGNSHRIGSEDKTVLENHITETHEALNLSKNWIEDRKISLSVVGGTVLADSYEATIEWMLTDGVENK